MAPSQPRYEAPDGVLVYLINQNVNGSPERRLAAHFVLDCLRSHRTPEETAVCLDELEEHALLDISPPTRAGLYRAWACNALAPPLRPSGG